MVISKVPAERLKFVDESCAMTNMTRIYGRAPRGQRIHEAVPYRRKHSNQTIIAAIGLDGLSAEQAFDGPLNGERFLEWVKTKLVPTLKPVLRPFVTATT